MKIKRKTFQTKISMETVGLFAYGIFLTTTLFSVTFYFQYIKGFVYNTLLIFSLMLMGIRELISTKYTRKTVYGIIISCLVAAMIWIADIPNRNIFMLTIFFVYFARTIPFEKIAELSLKISALFLIFIIVSSWAGIIPNYTTYSGGRNRKFIGFLYALHPSTIMFNITALNVYLKKSNITWKNIVLLLACNYFVFYQTRSRLTFFLAIILMLFAIVIKKFPDFLGKKRLFLSILTYGFPFFAFVSVICMYLYQQNVRMVVLLDIILDGRISMASDALRRYGLGLFGTKFSMIGNGLDIYGNNTSKLYFTYSYIDNWYDQILIRNGLLFFATIILIITLVARKIYILDQDGCLTVILFLLSLQSIIQDSIMCVYFNSFVFVIGFYLMNGFKKLRSGRSSNKIERGY